MLRHAALFLDLDGTLIEFAARPGDVRVDAPLRALLRALARATGQRLVIVSGRSAADLRHLISEPELAIAGSHGAEIQFPDGRLWTPQPIGARPHILEQLNRFQSLHPGVLVEQKPFGLALHYRLAEAAEAACLSLALEIAMQEGFVLQPGQKVIELKFHVTTKGDAVRTLMREPPLKGALPLFIGDDLTDEAGFEAASEMGGAGVLVGPLRPSHAAFRLESVSHALRWLEEAAERLS